MMKGIFGIVAIALVGVLAGGLIGIRDSAAVAFQPAWFTPVISWLYIGLNVAALIGLIVWSQGWGSRALSFLGLLLGWFFPVMTMVFVNPSEWMPHVVWAFMFLVPITTLLELFLRKRVRDVPAPVL
jgi:hypothetical protein